MKNKLTIIDINKDESGINKTYSESKNIFDLSREEKEELYRCFPYIRRTDLQGRKANLNISDVLALRVNKEIVCILLFWKFNKTIYIADFCTIKEQQGKGYGKYLMNYFLNKHKEYNVRLDVTRKNKVLKFYKKIGFKTKINYLHGHHMKKENEK